MASAGAVYPMTDPYTLASSALVPSLSIAGVPLSETCLGLLVIDKGKEVSFLFYSRPSNLVGHVILDKYVVPPLSTSRDPLVFRPHWRVNINNRVIQPRGATEMLEKLPFPRGVVATTQCSLPDLKGHFASLLMQVLLFLGVRCSVLLHVLTLPFSLLLAGSCL